MGAGRTVLATCIVCVHLIRTGLVSQIVYADGAIDGRAVYGPRTRDCCSHSAISLRTCCCIRSRHSLARRKSGTVRGRLAVLASLLLCTHQAAGTGFMPHTTRFVRSRMLSLLSRRKKCSSKFSDELPQIKGEQYGYDFIPTQGQSIDKLLALTGFQVWANECTMELSRV